MALVKKENISVAYEKYTDKTGQEKTAWKTIGEVLTFSKEDGTYSKMVKLYSMPGASISLFEQKPKEQKEQPHQKDTVPTIQQDPMEAQDTINPEKIPF